MSPIAARTKDSAEHGADDAGGAAEDEHREGDEREVGVEAVWLHRREPQAPDEPTERPDDATEGERLHLVEVDVLSQGAYGVLVLPDAAQHPSPG